MNFDELLEQLASSISDGFVRASLSLVVQEPSRKGKKKEEKNENEEFLRLSACRDVSLLTLFFSFISSCSTAVQLHTNNNLSSSMNDFDYLKFSR